ncbi:MAG TPA: hypothetical protein VFT87_03385 [Candidatus Saccharimonadales bacterium]|nr:hypothetical protein [Candidatus Saccharimonadales bacterium]
MTWGVAGFVGIVVADKSEELSDQAFSLIEMYWTRVGGEALSRSETATVDSFMETRSLQGKRQRSKVTTIPGLIQNFDTALATHLNR